MEPGEENKGCVNKPSETDQLPKFSAPIVQAIWSLALNVFSPRLVEKYARARALLASRAITGAGRI